MRFALLIASLAVFQALPGLAQTATISFFIGEVSVKGPGLAPAAPAKLNQSLKKGDTVKTGAESRAEIALADERGVLRVAENSQLTLEALDRGKQVDAQLGLGRIWLNIRKMAEDKGEVQVRSPVAAAAVRGTVYRMDVAADSTSLVRVYQGLVQVGWVPYQAFVPGQILQAPTEVAGPQKISQTQWIEMIRAGQQVRLGRDRQAQVGQFDLAQDAQDAWVRWNQQRDQNR